MTDFHFSVITCPSLPAIATMVLFLCLSGILGCICRFLQDRLGQSDHPDQSDTMQSLGHGTAHSTRSRGRGVPLHNVLSATSVPSHRRQVTRWRRVPAPQGSLGPTEKGSSQRPRGLADQW